MRAGPGDRYAAWHAPAVRTPLVALAALGLACGSRTGLEALAPRPADAGMPLDRGVPGDAGDLGPLPTFGCRWLWGEALTVAEGPDVTLGPAAVAAGERVALLLLEEDARPTGVIASTDPTPRRVAEVEDATRGARAYGLTSGFVVGLEGDATCAYLGWSTRGEALGFSGLATTPCLFGEQRGNLLALGQRDGPPTVLVAVDASGILELRASFSRMGDAARDFIAPVTMEGGEAFVVERAGRGSRVVRVGSGRESAATTGPVRAVAPDPQGPALLALVGGSGAPVELLRVEPDAGTPLELPLSVRTGEPPALLATSDTQALLFDAGLELWAVPLAAGRPQRVGRLPDANELPIVELQLALRPGGDQGGAFFTVATPAGLEARWRSLICER